MNASRGLNPSGGLPASATFVAERISFWKEIGELKLRPRRELKSLDKRVVNLEAVRVPIPDSPGNRYLMVYDNNLELNQYRLK
jgi:hypothetical protein